MRSINSIEEYIRETLREGERKGRLDRKKAEGVGFMEIRGVDKRYTHTCYTGYEI